MRAWRDLTSILLPVLLACPGPHNPTAEDAARYFGFENGRELVYAVEGGPIPTQAKIKAERNDSFADYVGFAATERNAGNIIQEVLFWGTDVESLRMLRIGDCLPNCTTFVNPPVMLKNPIAENTTSETATSTKVTNNSGTSDGPSERHVVTVGAKANVVTPAGTFAAYPMTWRRFVGGASTSEDRILYLATERGFVRIDKGTVTYKVQGGVTP